MRLQATIVLDMIKRTGSNTDKYEVERLLESVSEDYFTEFEVYQEFGEIVVEVYSEDEDAGDQTAGFLIDEGYEITMQY